MNKKIFFSAAALAAIGAAAIYFFISPKSAPITPVSASMLPAGAASSVSASSFPAPVSSSSGTRPSAGLPAIYTAAISVEPPPSSLPAATSSAPSPSDSEEDCE